MDGAKWSSIDDTKKRIYTNIKISITIGKKAGSADIKKYKLYFCEVEQEWFEVSATKKDKLATIGKGKSFSAELSEMLLEFKGKLEALKFDSKKELGNLL